MQPESELGASKRKQTQINASKIAFFYFYLFTFIFLESGLFNGLRPIQIKKIPLPLDSPVRLCLKRLARSPLPSGHLGICGFPSGKVYGGITDQPRICSLQSERGSRKVLRRQWFRVDEAKNGQLPAIAGCGVFRLSDRLPEISFKRTPRNARFRRDVAVWHMTLRSQNSSVGPLPTRSGKLPLRSPIGSFWRQSGSSVLAKFNRPPPILRVEVPPANQCSTGRATFGR
jgi:hypothetical protein